MERRNFLRMIGVSGVSLGLPGCLGLSNKQLNRSQKKPNIVYIMADDLGYGDISGINENGKIYTRHINSIAREGMIFTDAHSGSAVCTPTRYGVVTGRYSWRA